MLSRPERAACGCGRRRFPLALGRRGIALPVALLALVALTLMVTSVMLTSGSQGAAAAAHVDATQSLYDAESGLQRYVGSAASAQSALTVGASEVTVPGTTRQVQVVRALLFSQGAAPGGVFRIWAVTAEGIRQGTVSGRAVTALVRQYTPPGDLALDLRGALTLGGDLEVDGGAFAVDGRSACGTGEGVQAVRSAADARVSGVLDGLAGVADGRGTTGRAAIDATALTRDGLVDEVLGNGTLASIVSRVPAARTWCWTGGCRFRSGTPAADRPRFPRTLAAADGVAVVDGGGGTVGVSGGSGVLIVTNGGVSLGANAAFDGVIIVEGNVSLAGGATVTGALVSLAATGRSEIGAGAGHATVQYDQCKVSAAMNAFASQARASTTSSTTFAWAEVVR